MLFLLPQNREVLPQNGEVLPQQAPFRIAPPQHHELGPPPPPRFLLPRVGGRSGTGSHGSLCAVPVRWRPGAPAGEQPPRLGKRERDRERPPKSSVRVPWGMPALGENQGNPRFQPESSIGGAPPPILPTLSSLPEKPGRGGGAKPRTPCQHPAQHHRSCGRVPGDACALPVTPGCAGTAPGPSCLAVGQAASICRGQLSQPRFGPCLSLPKSRTGSGRNRALSIARWLGDPIASSLLANVGRLGGKRNTKKKKKDKKRQKKTKKKKKQANDPSVWPGQPPSPCACFTPSLWPVLRPARVRHGSGA